MLSRSNIIILRQRNRMISSSTLATFKARKTEAAASNCVKLLNLTTRHDIQNKFRFVICVFALLYGSAITADTSPEEKFKQMADLARRSKSNVITLDDATYAYYAINKPRPYSLIVLLTALNPKYKCGLCKNLDIEYSLMAESYREHMKKKKLQPELFFLRLDYQQAPRTFQNYETASVPLIFHIAKYEGEVIKKEYELLIKDRMEMSMKPDAESIAKFVTQKTGSSFNVQRSMFFSYVATVVFIGIIALLVNPIIKNMPFCLSIIQFKPLWMFVSAAVYTCAISGFIFDIIRSPPMYHQNPQSGQVTYFYPQSGNQFVVEGFIIGFLNMSCAAALILASSVIPKMSKGSSVPIIICLVVFLACFLQTRSFYIMKNRWYGSVM